MAVVHYSSGNYMHRANAAYLAGAFTVLFLDLQPEEVWRRLTASGFRFAPFRDASLSYTSGAYTYTITILHCLRAIKKAQRFNFFDFNDFDPRHYEFFQVDEYSELNWIVPAKLLAFSNPNEEPTSPINIDYLLRYFTINNVGVVIRLNQPKYCSSKFTLHGVKHYDLYFDDGTTPTKSILFTFFSIVERSRTAVAVHCKAGLGRTGCLIGAFLMKHYRLSSDEAIAWMRICRPAMVVGNQQDWLKKMEPYLWNAGDIWRMENFRSKHSFPHHEKGIYSKSSPPYNPSDIMQDKAYSNQNTRKPRISQSTSSHYRYPSERRQGNSEDLYCKYRSPRRDLSPAAMARDTMNKRDRPLSQGDYLVAAKKYRQQQSRLSTTR